MILAGISITALAGENGLITKSQEAKKLYTISSEKEGISAAVSASRIGDLESLELKNETLQKELDNQFGVGNAVATYDGDDTFTVEIKSTGNVYTIEDNQIIEGKYEKWDGTTSTEPTKNANKEIHIYTVSELKWLADQVNSGETFEEYKIYLENNLDLGARKENDTWDTENNRKVEWTSIGGQINSEQSKMNTLKATFEGNNHVVKGMYINKSDKNNQGLFGMTESDILNLTVKNSYISGNYDIAGIVGMNNKTITNCKSIDIEINCAGAEVGGIVGYKYGGKINNCYNSSKIKSECVAAGIVGFNYGNTIIEDCSNNGNIEGEFYLGGIVGATKTTNESIIIENCFNTGEIASTATSGGIGGIIGYIEENTNIKNCYNIGKIECTANYIGGIAGYIKNGEIIVKNSYNNAYIEGKDYVGGVVGYIGTGELTVENCYNSAYVGGRNNIGGIIGQHKSNATAKKCYNSGEIIAKSYNAGGIVGTGAYKIEDCYNIGKIKGGNAGGITGYLSKGLISNCYNIGEIDGTIKGSIVGQHNDSDSILTNCYSLDTLNLNTVGRDIGNEGGKTSAVKGEAVVKTAEEMKSQTMADLLGNTNWKYDSNKNQGYPVLNWQ